MENEQFSKEQTAKDEKFYSSVAAWKLAYQLTLGARQEEYKARLKELITSNKVQADPDFQVKITALQLLID